MNVTTNYPWNMVCISAITKIHKKSFEVVCRR